MTSLTPADARALVERLRESHVAGTCWRKSIVPAACAHCDALDALATYLDQCAADTARLDHAQELVLCADFDYQMERNDGMAIGEQVYVLRIPRGVRVGKNIRAFLDAALAAEEKR